MLTIFGQIAQIQEAGRRREKITLLRRFDSPTLRDALVYALSPVVTFGVERLAFDPVCASDLSPSVGEFLQLCIDLERRRLEDPEAVVVAHINRYPAHLRVLVAAVFTKTLDLGCDPGVVNEALPRALPLFGATHPRGFVADKVIYPCLARPALSGMRCLVFVTRYGAKCLSSSGVPIEPLRHLEQAFRECPHGVYDGVMSDVEGRKIEGLSIKLQFMTAEEDADLIHLNVVDYVPLAEWENPVTPAGERFKRLWTIYDRQKVRNLGASSVWFVINQQVIRNNLDLKYFNDLMLRSGWGGTVVTADKPYKKARTLNVMRLL